MKLKNQIILLIIFSFMNIIKTDNKPPQVNIDYPNITCGKKNPKKETDCTKYGTDSDMLCCYVKRENATNPFCTLFYIKQAEELLIRGKKTYEDGEIWSCGNKSVYLSNNIFIVLILIFFINFIL